MTGSSNDKKIFPAEGRLLGLDFGTKRVGVAVSTPEQTIASPLEIHTRQGDIPDAQYFSGLAAEYSVVGLVVGLPVHMSGDEGGKASEAREFGDWCSRTTGLPVRYWDERYTSAIAEEHLLAAKLSRKKRKARIDKLAAQIMLQSYLDAEDRERLPGRF